MSVVNPLLHFRVLIAVLLVVVGWNAHAQRSAGENIDDSTLATRTKGALVDTDGVSARHINVEVYRGVVQLGGFVESTAERDAALQAARRIDAATSVVDALVVLPGHRTVGQTVDDTTMQSKLKLKLVDGQGLGTSHKINTDVRQGHVLLSGFVDRDEQRKRAGEIAAAIDGVVKVHNLIAIKP
jgi:hyperosmotically inducible protein